MKRKTPIEDHDAALIEAAAQVVNSNFADGRHTVGAAIRCSSGRVYTGVNIEVSGYGPCAEPIALGAAISAGEREFECIVAVAKASKNNVALSPCGNCRQLLADYAPDVMVILPADGKLVKVRARELLPEPYNNRD